MKTKSLAIPAVAIFLAGCGAIREPDAPSESALVPVPVTVVSSSVQSWPEIYEATGTVRARSSTAISAKWMGYIRQVRVQVGDRVRKGELLIELDARDLETAQKHATAAREEIRNSIPEADSAISAANAHLDLVEATFQRIRQLYEKKSVSDQEFDEASAKLKAAQADFAMARARRAALDARIAQAEQEVRAAEVTRSYAEISAPADGIVTEKSADPGNLAMPGAPLLMIEYGGYRLEASIEESRISSIAVGKPAAVRLDGIGRDFDARVSGIVPAVDAVSRAFIVKIDLPDTPGLRSGIFGRAKFQLGTRSTLAIPAAAIIERGQLQSVLVLENGTARTRLITSGERAGDQIAVLSGISAGDAVILPPAPGVSDGTRVEVRP